MENLEIKSKQKDDVKSKINDVNKQLELQKNNLNKLDASEEQLSAVHKKIEKCQIYTFTLRSCDASIQPS